MANQTLSVCQKSILFIIFIILLFGPFVGVHKKSQIWAKLHLFMYSEPKARLLNNSSALL